MESTRASYLNNLSTSTLPLSTRAIEQLEREAYEEAKRRRAIKARRFFPDYRAWLRSLFPSYVSAPFAERHLELWDWGWDLEPGKRPHPFVAVWPRGGAKSTTAELLTVLAGYRESRYYVWYISGTQDQADKHVETIASMLESSHVARYHETLANRKVGKYGNVRGWRRQRLWTESGFTVDALGLDTGLRGARVEEHRPDLIVLDDVDDKLDSAKTTQKKIDVITTNILPAGSPDLAVLAIQNLIIPNGVFSRMVDGRADFLMDRHVSGPFPAVEGLVVEQNEEDGKHYIVDGEATWEGQNLAVCQDQIHTWGYTSFKMEAQHDIEAPPGGIFDHLEFRHCKWSEVPELTDVQVWVDPAVTSTDQSDSMGIQADGLAADETIYRLWSWENVTTPTDALERAILKAVELGASTVGVETDQGGDTWETVYEKAWTNLRDAGRVSQRFPPMFNQAKAGQGHGPKVHRAQQMLFGYERGQFVHVIGTHETLENALRRFPKTKPLDLVDASYWSQYHLINGGWATPPGG